MGDENPEGTFTFHFTFLSGPTSIGGFWPSATPDPPGPRNCGHGAGSAPRTTAANTPKTANVIDAFTQTPDMCHFRRAALRALPMRQTLLASPGRFPTESG